MNIVVRRARNNQRSTVAMIASAETAKAPPRIVAFAKVATWLEAAEKGLATSTAAATMIAKVVVVMTDAAVTLETTMMSSVPSTVHVNIHGASVRRTLVGGSLAMNASMH